MRLFHASMERSASAWRPVTSRRHHVTRAGDQGSVRLGKQTRQAVQVDLIKSLIQQAQVQTWPQVQDLTLPWLLGPPEQLTDTLAPELLADADSQFVVVDGVRLHFKEVVVAREGGSGQGQGGALALLLLHGLNGSTFNWRFSMGRIAQQLGTDRPCRVIALDRPPFGLSERPTSWPPQQPNPYTSAGGAALSAALLGRLGVTQAVVVGHSAGAAVAVQLALNHPQLVSGLVLVAPALAAAPRPLLASPDLGQVLRLAATRAALAADGPGLHYVRRQLRRRRDEVLQGNTGVWHDEARVSPDTIEGYLKPMQAADWDKGMLQFLRAAINSSGSNLTSSTPDYDRLRVPILVIQGDKDEAVPKRAALALVDRLQQRPPAAAEPDASGGKQRRGQVGGEADAGARGSGGGGGGGGLDAGDSDYSVEDSGGGGDSSGSTAVGTGAAAAVEAPVTEYVELPRCGHIPMEEYPQPFSDAVCNFVRRQVAPTPMAAGPPA